MADKFNEFLRHYHTLRFCYLEIAGKSTLSAVEKAEIAVVAGNLAKYSHSKTCIEKLLAYEKWDKDNHHKNFAFWAKSYFTILELHSLKKTDFAKLAEYYEECAKKCGLDDETSGDANEADAKKNFKALQKWAKNEKTL